MMSSPVCDVKMFSDYYVAEIFGCIFRDARECNKSSIWEKIGFEISKMSFMTSPLIKT